MVDHHVFLILREHDGDLWELSRRAHVWLAQSAANDEAAGRVWARETDDFSPMHGVTTFKSSCDRVADFYQFLGTIDEHHGAHAASPAWAAIHVRGVQIAHVAHDRIAAELEGAPFQLLPELDGFTIIRAAQLDAAADDRPQAGDRG